MFNVEVYDKTARRVVRNKTAKTEREASQAACDFITTVKFGSTCVIHESNYDVSPRGYVIGQTIITDTAEYAISVARM